MGCPLLATPFTYTLAFFPLVMQKSRKIQISAASNKITVSLSSPYHIYKITLSSGPSSVSPSYHGCPAGEDAPWLHSGNLPRETVRWHHQSKTCRTTETWRHHLQDACRLEATATQAHRGQAIGQGMSVQYRHTYEGVTHTNTQTHSVRRPSLSVSV